MDMVTRRGSFLELGEMNRTEFRSWWKAILREGENRGYILLDDYECPFESEAIAVAYAETRQGISDAAEWWDGQTDGECSLRLFSWNADERKFEAI